MEEKEKAAPWGGGEGMAFATALLTALAFVAFGGSAAAQTVVGDPKNPARTFSSYCSACHKTPAGLAQNSSAIGLNAFLRQHYTTGQEMSSAMAEYLIAARGDPRAGRAVRGEASPARRSAGVPDQPAAQETAPAQRRKDAAVRPPAEIPSPASAARGEDPAPIIAPERPARQSPQASRERSARSTAARPQAPPPPEEEPPPPVVEPQAAPEPAPAPVEERQPAFDAPSP